VLRLEATGARGKPRSRKQTELRGRQGVVGDGTVGRYRDMKQGYLPLARRAYWHKPPKLAAVGVRAFIVASKPGNAGGAKGRRKMEA
jgi:hypothetical protein